MANNNDCETELLKFCSPLLNVKWSLLNCFGNPNIFALELSATHFLSDGQINHIIPPIITFTFPILDTLEDRLELEELAAERHHCTLIPCSDFIVCPTTLFEPDNEPPLHQHCIDKNCVRFFERVLMEAP